LTEYFDKELAKLERQQRELRKRAEQGLLDRYNQPESQFEIRDYKDLVNSRIEFAPKEGQTWETYVSEVRVYAKANAKKNWMTHVDNSKKTWYTHTLPLGCFMCEDTNLISVLVRVIALMASKHPSQRF